MLIVHIVTEHDHLGNEKRESRFLDKIKGRVSLNLDIPEKQTVAKGRQGVGWIIMDVEFVKLDHWYFSLMISGALFEPDRSPQI